MNVMKFQYKGINDKNKNKLKTAKSLMKLNKLISNKFKLIQKTFKIIIKLKKMQIKIPLNIKIWIIIHK